MILIEVDTEMKAKWAINREKIFEAQRGGAESFIALWKAVTEVVESTPPLFLAGGYSSTTAFVEKFLKVPMRNASRFMDVARVASRADLERYGISKLDAAVGLLTGDNTTFEKVRVPVERKGKASKVGLEDATVVELRVAVRNLHPKRPAATTVRSAAAVMLTKALSDAKLKGVSVAVARSGIAFRGLQMDQLPVLATLLSRLKLPANGPALRRVA